ncbi:MAG: homoserine O-succinyltransferase [Chlamydiota bacterium]|nr:homoserine O-succinyltransferase [Chlamydiota bacterium]
MTVVLPKDYHITKDLEKKGVICISPEKAIKEDIRALRIGILNIMPEAEKYEFSLLHPLGRSVMQIEPIWLRLRNHQYRSTDKKHLDRAYVSFEDAIDGMILDGLIVTGAPVEEIPFEEISYWPEIQEILQYARKHIASTLGLCWGGMALAKFLGIDNILYDKKLFGAFETTNLIADHPITGEMDDVFWCPQSRHSGYLDQDLEKARDKGVLNLLAYGEKGGYTIFESTDHRFVMNLGHLEYESERLIFEYDRDVELGREDVHLPENIDLKKPINRWRGNRTEFYAQWIKYIHETTVYP